MMLALLAAAVAQTAPPAAGRAVVQASATVRIVAGAQVKLGEQAPDSALRRTRVRDSDGQLRPARLIEFH